MDKSKLVALYVRVSTSKQVEHGYSLEAQEKVLKEEVLHRDLRIFRIYSDAGISGAEVNRSGLNALLEDAKQGLFSYVGVWTISRISRNLLHLLDVLDILDKAGVQCFSISEGFDMNKPIGRFAIQMMGGIAQFQRESWREASILGSKKKAKLGKYAGVRLLGYKTVPDVDDLKGSNKLEVEQEEAGVVGRIFEVYASGRGLKATARILNQEGLRGKNGKPFSIQTIRQILTNPAYIGMVKYAGEYYIGVHEPIIEKNLWDRVQKLLATRKRYDRCISYEYLLSGIIKCPACGRGMIPSHVTSKNKAGCSKIYYYYTCGLYMNKGTGNCKPNVVRAKEADATVLRFLKIELGSKVWMDVVMEEIRKRLSSEEENQQTNDDILGCLEKLKAKKTTFLLSYENGEISKERFLAEIREVQASIDSMEKTIDRNSLPVDKPSFSEEEIRNAFAKLPELLEKAGYQEKRQLIRGVVKAAYVDSCRYVSEVDVYIPSIAKGLPRTIRMKIREEKKGNGSIYA